MPTGTTDAPVRWGMLGAANIALKKVIPAMRGSERSRVVAIASRDEAKARRRRRRARHSARLRFVRGADRRPGHRGDLQSAAESSPRAVVDARGRRRQACAVREADRAVGRRGARALSMRAIATACVIGEAFMVRTHPQWLGVRELIDGGRIGDLRLVIGHFSYYRRDPATSGAASSGAAARCSTSDAIRSRCRAGCSAPSRSR